MLVVVEIFNDCIQIFFPFRLNLWKLLDQEVKAILWFKNLTVAT